MVARAVTLAGDMATAVKHPTRPKAKPPTVPLRMFAWLAESAADSAKLKVDRQAGVIYGVRVCGRFSPNTHGDPEATQGTEYLHEALEAARPLYEGAKVMCDHPADKNRPAGDRPVRDVFGVLRNYRVEPDGSRADLHYLKKHPMAESVVEDVERGMGLYGLSHNARDGSPGRAVRDGRRVVSRIESVRSVDLVDRPATNKNLWESLDVTTTLKTLLESRKPSLSTARQAWATHLLEMDDLAGPMDAPAPVATDPDEALKGGFEAAATAIVQQMMAGDLDDTAGLKKLKELMKAHSKLTGDAEPEAPVEESEGGDKPKDDEKKDKPDMAESVELAALKRKDAARDLCESLQFVPTKDQLAALVEIQSDAARKTAAEAFKAAAAPRRGPLSRSPITGTPLVESRDAPKTDVTGFATRLLG
jgi:hypothetical protein